jgi:hypothetical protein
VGIELTPSPAPLSRLYLIAAALAAALGLLSLGAHLTQPRLPELPGMGCIVTQFPSPGRTIPAPYLELRSCLHVSQTTLDLALYQSSEGPIEYIFSGSAPEDPRRWAEFLNVRWIGRDTVEVAYTPRIPFISRQDTAGTVRVRYTPKPRDGG